MLLYWKTFPPQKCAIRVIYQTGIGHRKRSEAVRKEWTADAEWYKGAIKGVDVYHPTPPPPDNTAMVSQNDFQDIFNNFIHIYPPLQKRF